MYKYCIMTTINISLPVKLKVSMDTLVDEGFYVSFSDAARDAFRELLEKRKYDRWAAEAKKDLKKGKSVILKTPEDIDKYFDSL